MRTTLLSKQLSIILFVHYIDSHQTWYTNLLRIDEEERHIPNIRDEVLADVAAHAEAEHAEAHADAEHAEAHADAEHAEAEHAEAEHAEAEHAEAEHAEAAAKAHAEAHADVATHAEAHAEDEAFVYLMRVD
jgi:uncharacterized membrane protein